MRFYRRIRHFLYIYALLFTLCFGVLTMAKYTGVVEETGTVSIAKWDVSVAGEDSQTLPTITIGDSTTYQVYNLNVTSESEVALTYDLKISNVPNDLIVEIDNVEYQPINNEIIIDDLGSFEANDAEPTKVHTMKFIVPIDSETIDAQKLDIDVVFTQVAM